MKPYIIVKGDTIHDLEFKVENKIKEKYLPIGGVCSVQKKGSTYSWFYQAMVLTGDKENVS